MELHLVAAVSIAVVRAQHRRMIVSKRAPFHHFRPSQFFTESLQFRVRPGATFPCQGFTQGAVGRKQVVLHQRWRLIQDLLIHEWYPTPSVAEILVVRDSSHLDV